MYELAKIVGFLFSPLTVSLLLGLLALVFFWLRHWKTASLLAVSAVGGLWVAGTPAFSYMLSSSLERQHPFQKAEAHSGADVIVVLGGGLSGASPPRRPEFDMGAAADRVWHAAALYHAGKAPRILATGGGQPGAKQIDAEAVAMAQMLKTLGVPRAAIVLEDKSRNTHENARFSRPLLEKMGARRALLVTSAQHMPRALRTFSIHLAGTGMTLIPAATDFEALPNTLHKVGRWFPDAGSLAVTSSSVKEYIGLMSLHFVR